MKPDFVVAVAVMLVAATVGLWTLSTFAGDAVPPDPVAGPPAPVVTTADELPPGAEALLTAYDGAR